MRSGTRHRVAGGRSLRSKLTHLETVVADNIMAPLDCDAFDGGPSGSCSPSGAFLDDEGSTGIL